MPRRRGSRSPSDYGPPEQAWRRAVLAVPDPQRPTATVLRARALTVHYRLYATGRLTGDEHAAAERLAAAFEITARCTAGLRDATGSAAGGRVPTAEELQAAQDIRHASALLGQHYATVVIEVVALGRWPVPVASAEAAPPAAIAMLRAALRRLASEWGMA